MSFGLGKGRELQPGGFGVTLKDLPPPPPEGSRLGHDFFFPRSPGRRFELEIGSGKGTFLLQEAVRFPETDFLGIEYAGEFYRYAADRARRHALENVRLLYADAGEFVKHWLDSDSVSVVHLYFSDPWPKKRHHKRRVVQDASLTEFHRVLRRGGELRLVTDHVELWAWYEEHAARAGAIFERLPFDAAASAGADEVVGSNFERKYRREQRPFHAMTLRRREAPPAASTPNPGPSPGPSPPA